MRYTAALSLAALVFVAACGGDGPTQSRPEVKKDSVQIAGGRLLRHGKPGGIRAMLNSGRLNRAPAAESTVCLKYKKQLARTRLVLHVKPTTALRERETSLNAQIADVCN